MCDQKKTHLWSNNLKRLSLVATMVSIGREIDLNLPKLFPNCSRKRYESKSGIYSVTFLLYHSSTLSLFFYILLLLFHLCTLFGFDSSTLSLFYSFTRIYFLARLLCHSSSLSLVSLFYSFHYFTRFTLLLVSLVYYVLHSRLKRLSRQRKYSPVL